MKFNLLVKYLIPSLFLICQCVFAGVSEQKELDDINQRQEQFNIKRDWAKYRLDEKQRNCYQKFFTNNCLDNAQSEYRSEIREIRAQETLMHDRQRALKSIIKDEKFKERQDNRADPQKEKERSDNVKKYDQKQIDASKRQEDVDKKRSDAAAKAEEHKKLDGKN